MSELFTKSEQDDLRALVLDMACAPGPWFWALPTDVRRRFAEAAERLYAKTPGQAVRSGRERLGE